MTSATKAQVDEVLYVPAALALHQRPAVPVFVVRLEQGQNF